LLTAGCLEETVKSPANKDYVIVAMVAEAGREMVDNAVRAGREALQDEWSIDL